MENQNENPIINPEPINPKPINPKPINTKPIPSGRKFVAVSMRSSHSGPLPSPEVFARYEQILPGAADRILSMAEIQASHRQKMESIIIRSGSRDSLLGVIFAFLIGVIVIAGGVYVTVKGYPWVGGAAQLTGLGTLVGVFIHGTRSRKNQSENEDQPDGDAAEKEE